MPAPRTLPFRAAGSRCCPTAGTSRTASVPSVSSPCSRTSWRRPRLRVSPDATGGSSCASRRLRRASPELPAGCALLKRVSERQIHEALLLLAEADVDAGDEGARQRESHPAAVAVAEVVLHVLDRGLFRPDVGDQLVVRDEDAAGLAEDRPVDEHVPEVEEVELEELCAILRGAEHTRAAEEAMGEEAAQRVVAA